jgi:ketosteroid isomerase-like protein
MAGPPTRKETLMTMTGPQIAATLDELVPDEATVARDAIDLPDHIATFRGWSLSWIAAWNARDIDAIAEHVTDDIVYDDPGMWGELVEGKAAFRENLAMIFRGFPDLRFVPADWPPMFSLDGRHAAAPCRAIATFSGDLGGGPSRMALAGTNRTLDLFCLDLYEFRDGKLSRWTALNQEFELARQAGFAPSGTMLSALVQLQRATAPIMRLLTTREHAN